MLYNIRYDLDGTHYDTDAEDSAGKEGTNAGCLNNTCKGYELVQDLNFDENNNGLADDTYNQNAGWLPIAHKTNDSVVVVPRKFTCVATAFLNLSGTSMTMPSQCDSNPQSDIIRILSSSSYIVGTAYPCGDFISATLDSKSGSTITVTLDMNLPANNLLEKTVSCSNATSLSYTDTDGITQTILPTPTEPTPTYTYPDIFDLNATPSFVVGEEFEAIFEGNNFAIQNLSIDRPIDAYVGLFGYVGTSGAIRNLTLSSKANVIGLTSVALLAGHNDGTIQNITLDITQPDSATESNVCATTKFNNATTKIGEAVGAGTAVSNLIITQAPRTEKTSFDPNDPTAADTVSDCD